MKTEKLEKIVRAFRKGILGSRDPDMMCRAVCYPLQSYLSQLGVTTELVEGSFKGADHVWLKMSDGNIIDPTADQFSGPLIKMPKVYIGPKPMIYDVM